MTQRDQEALPIYDPDLWPALFLAIALMALGCVFVFAPRLGAAIFGLPAPEGSSAAWVAVVGVRDLVFGSYVLVLASCSTRRAVGLVLGMTALIPLGDILIVLAIQGFTTPGHLLLHLASLCAMAIAAVWTLRHRSPSAG